jgi:hypothetical protein
MLESSTSASCFDTRLEMALEKYWKVPPSGPPEKARRVLAARGEKQPLRVLGAGRATR